MSFKPSPIIPRLRYDDAVAMIDWLVAALGFEKHAIHQDESGDIAHAELRIGTGIIMLGPAKESGSALDKLFRPQSEVGAATAQTIYIVVDDLDAHHDRAKAAGAEILMSPTDQDYGSRDYICKDPEGHIWCFGTYRPEPLAD